MEMNQAAYAAFDKANERMEDLVGQLKQRLKDDPEGLAELDAAQSAFTEFRDAQSTLAGNLEARGGSMMPMVAAAAAEAMTTERNALLQARLDQFDGV
jgi:uncharacterized protein YecT (DUF1311 family)